MSAHHLDKQAYQQALTEHGFYKIGAGLYSTVYTRDNWDYVIKVGNGDDDWTQYIIWATQNGYAGTFAPKVYSLKFHGGWYVALMERLVTTVAETKIDRKTGNWYPMPENNPYRDLHDAIRVWSGNRWSDGSEPNHPDLKAFVEAMRDNNFSSDLHDSNVMIRKDGQIVITDPSSKPSFRKSMRIKHGNIINAKDKLHAY